MDRRSLRRAVLDLDGAGFRPREIARRLGIAGHTVAWYLRGGATPRIADLDHSIVPSWVERSLRGYYAMVAAELGEHTAARYTRDLQREAA